MQNGPRLKTCIVSLLYANRSNKIRNESTTGTWSASHPGMANNPFQTPLS
jgi:hypothetical protein